MCPLKDLRTPILSPVATTPTEWRVGLFFGPSCSRLKGGKKLNKSEARMLWNFGQGLWNRTSPKCVVTHLFHSPLPSECLQKDWRVNGALQWSCISLPLCKLGCVICLWRQGSRGVTTIIFMHAGQSTCSTPMIGCTLVISRWPRRLAPICVPHFLSTYYQEILKMYCTVLSMLQTKC